MPNFAATGKDTLDSINYLLAGPQTVGQASQGYWNFPGGYFNWQNALPPYIQDTAPPGPIPDGKFFYTPAYVFVNTTSSTDSVLVTAQLRPFISADPMIGAPWEFYLSVDVYRYLVYENSGTASKFFNYELIAQDNNYFNDTMSPNMLAGNESIGETVFCSIVDKPGVGRWCYSLELNYSIYSGTPVLDWVYGENIGITATVIKV